MIHLLHIGDTVLFSVADNNRSFSLLQDISDAVVSDEATQISARHAEVPHAVRKL